MPDLRQFANTLSKILPFLAQEKMQRENIRRYLESNLQENAAREATASRLQTQEVQDAIARTLAGSTTQSLENISGGRLQMPRALTEVLDPRYTGGLRVPPEYAGDVARINEAITNMNTQFQSGQPISEDISRVLSTQVAPGILQDIVQTGESGKLERGRQAIDIAGQEIRKGELAAQESKVTGEKGKTTEIKALLSSTQQQIRTLQKQLELGAFGGLSGVDQPAVQAQVESLSKKVDTYRNYLEEKILSDPKLKDADYLSVIEGLKAKNWNKFRFMSNPEFQTTMLLNGYAITKLIQLWK